MAPKVTKTMQVFQAMLLVIQQHGHSYTIIFDLHKQNLVVAHDHLYCVNIKSIGVLQPSSVAKVA